MVRIAQLGVAQPHAAGYLDTLLAMPDVEVIAGYSWEPEVARGTLPEAIAGIPLYDSIELLFEREAPEAIVVCLPPKLVPDILVSAANRGIHVLVEKPCARTAAEFLPAAIAIEQAGTQIATGFLRHFSPVAREMRSIVQQGLLGDLMSADISFMTANVQRRDPNHWFFQREMTGGGILHWLGCHWIDLFNLVTGSDATSVNAMLETRSVYPIDVEDVASVSLAYGNGMIASLHCAYVLESGTDQVSIRFAGTHGWMTWDGVGPELRVRSAHPAWASAPNRTLRFEPDPVPGYGGAMGMEAMQTFIASFRDGAAPEFTTRDILRVLDVLDASQQSSREQRRIDVAHTDARQR
ncbi:Gfo/Idh/MocA family oxidoreductase [soil metagenome]